MVSEGNGFANIWNWPVRESNRIVWLLFVNAKMYLDAALYSEHFTFPLTCCLDRGQAPA